MPNTRNHIAGKETTGTRSIHSVRSAPSPLSGSAEPPHPSLIALARQAAEADLAAQRAAQHLED